MSQGMDPYLAELFNTNGHAEKVAYVQDITGAFIKQAEEEGVDLSGIDEDQLVEAALAWAQDMEEGGGEDGYDPAYLEGPENLGPKTSEVDFLGRYMAHAYNDELEKIATMGDIGKAIKGTAQEYGKRIADSKTGKWIGDRLGSLGHRSLGLTSEARSNRLFNRGVKALPKVTNREEMYELLDKGLRRRGAGVVGLSALGLGGAGYGGYRLLKGRSKKSHIEALDDAAIERANELLKLAGEGYEMDFEDVAETDEDDLDRVITELAWSKLQDEGYIE